MHAEMADDADAALRSILSIRTHCIFIYILLWTIRPIWLYILIFSSPLSSFYCVVLVCDCCRCAIVTLADGVVKEGNEFGGQYCEPEPKDPYREPELPEGFEDGKFNLIL